MKADATQDFIAAVKPIFKKIFFLGKKIFLKIGLIAKKRLRFYLNNNAITLRFYLNKS